MLTMLPDAILREREAMLNRTIEALDGEGYEVDRAHDLAGLPETDELLIHVLNVHLRPDIHARCAGRQPLNAFVEVSTALTHDDCGRRWQALAAWCATHGAAMHVFVHPEDERLARELAKHWQIDPVVIRTLARGRHQ